MAVNELTSQGNFEGAIAKAGEALKQFPKSHLLYINRGSTLVHIERYEEAREDLNEALELSPPEMHWTIELLLARAEAGLGSAARAEEHFAKAAELMAKDPEPNPAFAEQLWRLRGMTLAADMRHKEAVQSFSKAMEVQPDNMRALAGRALSYAAIKDSANFDNDLKLIEQANPELAQALREEAEANNASESTAEGLTMKGLAKLRAGDHEAAISFFDRAIKMDPRFAQAFQKKGSSLQSLKRHAEAVECYTKSYQLQSDEVSLFNRAICYLNMGKLDQGKADLEKFVKVSKSPPEIEKAKALLSQF